MKLPKGWKRHKKYEPLSLGVMGYSYELLCPHGIGHDSGVHGCDGCCSKIDSKFFKRENLKGNE